MQCIPTTHVYPRIVFKPMKMKNRLRSASVEDTAELSPEYKQIVDFVTHGWSSVKLEMEQGDVWKYHQDNKQQTKKCKGHYWLLIVCRGHEGEVLPGEVQPAAGGLLPVWPGRVVGAPPLPEPHHRPVTAPRGDGQAAQVSTCSREKAWLVKLCITFEISIWSIIQNMWLKSYLEKKSDCSLNLWTDFFSGNCGDLKGKWQENQIHILKTLQNIQKHSTTKHFKFS